MSQALFGYPVLTIDSAKQLYIGKELTYCDKRVLVRRRINYSTSPIDGAVSLCRKRLKSFETNFVEFDFEELIPKIQKK